MISLAQHNPELLKEWDYQNNTIKPSEISYKSTIKVWWKCKKCGHIWKTKIDTRTRNNCGCPLCGRKKADLGRSKSVKCIETNQIYDSLIDAEINERCHRIWGKRDIRGGGNSLCAEHQLCHAEGRADGTLLDHSDDLVCKGGQYVLDRLGEDNQLHPVHLRKTERTCGLHLSGVYGENACTEDFRHIGGAVECQSHDAGNEAAQVNKAKQGIARNVDHTEQAEIDDRELHQKRGGAKDCDIRAGDAAYQSAFAKAH